MIENLDNKNTKLKEDLAVLDLKFHAKDEEIAQLKAKNFELNQRILNQMINGIRLKHKCLKCCICTFFTLDSHKQGKTTHDF